MKEFISNDVHTENGIECESDQNQILYKPFNNIHRTHVVYKTKEFTQVLHEKSIKLVCYTRFTCIQFFFFIIIIIIIYSYAAFGCVIFSIVPFCDVLWGKSFFFLFFFFIFHQSHSQNRYVSSSHRRQCRLCHSKHRCIRYYKFHCGFALKYG